MRDFCLCVNPEPGSVPPEKMEKDFRALFEANYNNLCRVAWRILSDRDLAREVVQEVFVELWRKGQWQQLQSSKAYLYVAVYNRSLSELQKSKRFLSEDSLPLLTTDHSDTLEEQELERIIVSAIEALPDQCKKIFILSREEELTYREIAARLGLSIKTVERQMGIALKKIRDYLDRHWGF